MRVFQRLLSVIRAFVEASRTDKAVLACVLIVLCDWDNLVAFADDLVGFTVRDYASFVGAVLRRRP